MLIVHYEIVHECSSGNANKTTFSLTQAISLEVLSLYSRPRKFLDGLEKEVSVLRERLAKKQVDIKEITVKKATPSGTVCAL